MFRLRLGIIDWGIGGVSIYKLVRERLGLSVTYLSDTGVTPYGKMTRPELTARLNAVIAYLKSREVTHLVIGCNAASTAVGEIDAQGLIVEGMIDNAVRFASKLKPKRLAVIGGRRTVLSGVYREGFREKGIDIDQRIAQPLSGLIEAGDVGSDRLNAEARRILAPIRNSSHILLACTHYPAIAPVLSQFVSPATVFIDPAESLLPKIAKWSIDPGGNDIFLTTGDAAAMRRSAKLAFSVETGVCRRVEIL